MDKVSIKTYNSKPKCLLINRKKYEAYQDLLIAAKRMASDYINNTINTDPKKIVSEIKYYFESMLNESGIKECIKDFEIVLVPPQNPFKDEREDVLIIIEFVEEEDA